MAENEPRTGPRHEHERHYERAADPAEAADRPLEPRSASGDLSASDKPGDQPGYGEDPHHALNTHVGEIDPDADSDPFRTPTPEDESDRASGTQESGQGVEDR